MSSPEKKPTANTKIKFALMSLIGVFLFMVPLPDGEGAFNIPLGFAIGWIGGLLNRVTINDYGLVFLMAAVFITLSLCGTILAYTVKPGFIMNNEKIKDLFHCNIVYLISKIIGFALVWMVFFQIGPAVILDPFDGAGLMMSLISGSTGLIAIFIVIGMAIPILTDFGLMEFLGTLIRKAMRALFTLPGRSSIDLLGSWFSSSAASVMITRDQHERGYYTDREAAAICVNFTIVSLPFTFFIAGFIDLMGHFPIFYLVITLTTLALAVIMPRIWPLRGIKDEYLSVVGKQIKEEADTGGTLVSRAVNLAASRASQTGATDVIKSGLHNWLNIFMDLIPVILAWGTIALILEAQTPIFDILAWPFRWMLELFRVQGAAEYAATTVVGFVDMFIPAILLSIPDAYGNLAPTETRFILGALSIVQIIYMAETGILILKSKMPLHIGHLLILFVMRTVLALPLIVLMTRVFANF